MIAGRPHDWFRLRASPDEKGRDNLFTLQPDKTPRGFTIEMPGVLVGYLRYFDSHVTDRMHLADCLLRTPDSLGRLLRAAGGAALTRTDKLAP